MFTKLSLAHQNIKAAAQEHVKSRTNVVTNQSNGKKNLKYKLLCSTLVKINKILRAKHKKHNMKYCGTMLIALSLKDAEVFLIK